MNFNENPKQPLTLENLGEIYRKKLDDILYMELTVENINDFAKTAEKRLLKLNDEILKQYSSNPLFEANKTFTIKEQEDDAYKKLGLPNLQDILKLIVDKIEQINGLKHSIQVQKNFSNEIITPPQPGGTIIEPGAGTFVEKEKLPRLLTLIYILNNDLQIPLDGIDILEGRVKPEMMRKTPYSRVIVPSLNRIVYICDEEDNASYIFDAQKLEVHEIDIVMLDIDDKNEKNELIIKYPGIGVRINQSKSWRKIITKALIKPIKIDFDQNRSEREIIPRKKSEFIKDLTYPDFQSAVQKCYQEQNSPGDIKNWYRLEYKNHVNWPAAPNEVYANSGWESWTELAGREKKEFLPFAEFQTAVIKQYEKDNKPNNIFVWYSQEYNRHKGWPSTPTKIYQNDGCNSWTELVGLERPEKKEFLPFVDFQTEVQIIYEEQGRPKNIVLWYRQEYKRHEGWPSAPIVTYKNDGWQSWTGLVGKETQNWTESVGREKQNRAGLAGKEKMSILQFADFIKEAQELYRSIGSKGSIINWYMIERKNHPNWPADPAEYFASKGWQGWGEIAAIKFEEFQAEVQKCYQDQGSPSNIIDWYAQEYKSHPTWPSVPRRTFKNKGWEGWQELVSKEKKIFPPYNEFQAEVRKVYQEQGSPINIFGWYLKEYRKHVNWPSGPVKFYAKDGCQSWGDLVNKEKRIYLPFAQFIAEVRKLYQKQGNPPNIVDWYLQEYKNHFNWPSQPKRIYENEGWKSWEELIGREKKKFLSYNDFKEEVRRAYLVQGRPSNVNVWYRMEYKKHPHWHSNPSEFYAKEGWSTLSDLVQNH